MDYQRFVSICYPNFRNAATIIEQLPLKHRSLLIKACQAQLIPVSPSTLYTLLSEETTFSCHEPYGSRYHTIPLREIFHYFQISPEEPCQSAILLDLLRSAPASSIDFQTFRLEGWRKEIILSQSVNTSHIDFDYFFNSTPGTRPHPLLPHNLRSRAMINATLHRFRSRYTQFRPTLFSRYTHKNMSYATRREYTYSTGDGLEGIPIFGQDDWVRHYHRTGEQLEGSTEMRQKWYPSGPKPRTYFAMGGKAYANARFLQDFFTDLTNVFPSTNHIQRLEPYRLRLEVNEDDQPHYLIYDLSSFTSNMQAQRSFCRSLAEFFKGVEVEVFDEHYGRYLADLGEMLEDYNEHCVDYPLLNQERVPDDVRTVDGDYHHGAASMLGIYGNLMTCTVAHFMIVSLSVENPYEEDNTAGDDGMILFFLLTYYSVLIAISLVGVFAIDKTFRSDEPGAIALKRPVYEDFDPDTQSMKISTKDNLVPPTLAVAVSYLEGYNVDPRYTIFYGEAGSLDERISVVGKDLLRFLDSAYSLNYNSVLVQEVYDGFRRLTHRITGINPVPNGMVKGRHYTWPHSPSTYSFLIHDPFYMIAVYSVSDAQIFPKTDAIDYETGSLGGVGDTVECNSSPWLKLMETLEYVVKEEVKIVKVGPDVIDYLYTLFRRRSLVLPVVYRYEQIKEIPSHMY